MDDGKTADDRKPDERQKLILAWRGRTVLSDAVGNPPTWFMSKFNDPADWDYKKDS